MLNWFEFCERVGDSEAVNANLEEVYQQLTSVLSEDEVREVELSKEALNADQKHTATAEAGIVVC